MIVEKLAQVINKVCGLNEDWAKTCIYYCLATHQLKEIHWMPTLDIVGVKGTGKTQLCNVLRAICYRPYDIVGHLKMTSATIRNEFFKAENRTAIVEEGDLFPNRRELEAYLINRTSKKTTSHIAVTHQVESSKGGSKWVTEKFKSFGATILHDRQEMIDLAAERRSIVVPLKYQRGRQFVKIDSDAGYLKRLALPATPLGKVPELFNSPDTSGSALDAWEPLIRAAEGMGDEAWLLWACKKVVEMQDKLADGQHFELEMAIFGAMVKAYHDRTGMGLMVDDILKNPLPLSDISSILRTPYPWIHEKTISTQLKKFGFPKPVNIGGTYKLRTTLADIRRIAKEVDYEDEKV